MYDTLHNNKHKSRVKVFCLSRTRSLFYFSFSLFHADTTAWMERFSYRNYHTGHQRDSLSTRSYGWYEGSSRGRVWYPTGTPKDSGVCPLMAVRVCSKTSNETRELPTL